MLSVSGGQTVQEFLCHLFYAMCFSDLSVLCLQMCCQLFLDVGLSPACLEAWQSFLLLSLRWQDASVIWSLPCISFLSSLPFMHMFVCTSFEFHVVLLSVCLLSSDSWEQPVNWEVHSGRGKGSFPTWLAQVSYVRQTLWSHQRPELGLYPRGIASSPGQTVHHKVVAGS